MNLFSLLFSHPLLFVVILLAFLVILTVHEAAHAQMAAWLGDLTAKRAHRLSLNPLDHIDWLGFVMLIAVGFGWGKPVPFNPYNLKYPKWGPVLVAAAGPLSNFLIGIVFGLFAGLLGPWLGDTNLLVFFFGYGSFLSFLLGLFNLVPIPPLDGSKVLLAFLSSPRYRSIRLFLETRGTLLLLILLFLDLTSNIGVFSALSSAASFLADLFTRLV